VDYKEASKKESAHHSMSLFEAKGAQIETAAYYYETHYLNDDAFEVCSEAEPEELPADKIFIEVTTTTTTFKMNAT
jgi:hypothetical protein